MKFIFNILLIIILSISSSCISDYRNDDLIEGKKAMLRLSFNSNDRDLVITTKAINSSKEKVVNNLYVFIFEPDGEISIKKKITDWESEINMDVFSGTGMRIFVIANYDCVEAQLDNVTNEADLDDISIYAGNIAVNNPEYLTMIGEITMDLIASVTNSASITLSYIAAKITIVVKDMTDDQDITLRGWRVYDIPAKGYLIGRQTDAVDVSSKDDFYNMEEGYSWERVEILNKQTTALESFYMFENRRGINTQSLSHATKTTYAPAKASYMNINLNCYNKNDDKTYSVSSKLYLGANDYNDYNIERGKHYTWTITINGVNSITTDVSTNQNTEAEGFPINITVSSLITMDAHPSQRDIAIKGTGDNIEDVSIEILDEAKRSYSDAGFNANWLKISPLPLNFSQIRQPAPYNTFQQEGEIGYFVRPRYIPHKSVRASLGSGYNPPNGIIINESGTGNGVYDASDPSTMIIPDSDDCLPWNQSTYRMCYMITDIPFYPGTANAYDFYIYSDEFDYTDGNSIRHGYVRISFKDKSDNSLKHLDYRLPQRQAMYIGKIIDTYDNDYIGSGNNGKDATAADIAARTKYTYAAIESIEESAIRLHASMPSAQQYTITMQWGYSGHLLYTPTLTSDKYRNGYFLTANAVYGNGTAIWTGSGIYEVTKNSNGSNVQWSNETGNHYRTKYGSLNYNTANNGLITEPTVLANSGTPYYIPNRSSSVTNNDYYDPVYNSSAARYCHEKNKDINGDGILSPTETKWYLPSQHELYQIWISVEAIRNSTTEYGKGYYWSSSEADASNAFNIGYTTGNASSARPKNSNQTSTNHNESIRCMRKITK